MVKGPTNDHQDASWSQRLERVAPGLGLDAEAFRAFLSAKAVDVDALADDRMTDLALVFACLQGKTAATQRVCALIEEVFTQAIVKFPSVRDQMDDLVQTLQTRLLVDDASRGPKLATYAGTGALRGWLLVAATRMIVNVVTRGPKEAPFDATCAAALQGIAVVDGLGARSGALRDVLKRALVEGSKKLTSKERTLLRYAYTDGRNVQEIGEVFGVHGSTVSRWMTRARAALLEGVRDALRSELGIGDDDMSSVLRDAVDNIDTTLGIMKASVSQMLAARGLDDRSDD